jgi:hypothetical protein
MSAFNYNINLGNIAMSGKQIPQLIFGRGRGNVFDIYFVGHNRFQSLSQIFFRVADAVELFGFEFVSAVHCCFYLAAIAKECVSSQICLAN